MIRDFLLVLSGCAVLVLVLASLMSQPRLTVTVSPEIEAAAVRIIQEHAHDR